LSPSRGGAHDPLAADRTHNETLQLTQEFLAQILGSRRFTVTVAAGQLQREGLIEYTRGRITIVNRPALESRACKCYQILRGTYDRLIGREY
jgi:DNA-binding GntR family transcriptional regulator